jgi:hypothetical protein
MRKVAGVLLVAALAVPAGMVAFAPAGAAGGTVCSTALGSAVFTPPLPVVTSKVLVKGTLVATGTLGKCVGGGVTSAHTLFKSPKATTGSNCKTLITFDPKSKGTIGTETITWNTGTTSTVALTLKQVKGAPTKTNITGTVTAGLFKGSHQTGQVTYKTPAGACTTKPLAKVTYSGSPGIKGVIK